MGGLTRAVLLDALGTLLELEAPGPGLQQSLAARGIDVSAAEAEHAMAAEIAYYRAHLMMGADDGGLWTLRRRCAEVLADALPERAGRALAPEEVEAALLDALRFAPFAEVPGALAALRAAGARLVAVSNWDRSLHDVLAATGLRPLLDGVVTSAEAGTAKPDPAIFAHALAIAGAPASSALHVGDSLAEDVAGARAAGIEAVLLRREGDPPAGAADVPLIHSLDELLVRAA